MVRVADRIENVLSLHGRLLGCVSLLLM